MLLSQNDLAISENCLVARKEGDGGDEEVVEVVEGARGLRAINWEKMTHLVRGKVGKREIIEADGRCDGKLGTTRVEEAAGGRVTVLTLVEARVVGCAVSCVRIVGRPSHLGRGCARGCRLHVMIRRFPFLLRFAEPVVIRVSIGVGGERGGALRAVRSHVAMHVAVGGESHRADSTLERTLAAVDEHVTVERAGRAERLAADAARVGMVGRVVLPDVHGERVLRVEPGVADGTFPLAGRVVLRITVRRNHVRSIVLARAARRATYLEALLLGGVGSAGGGVKDARVRCKWLFAGVERRGPSGLLFPVVKSILVVVGYCVRCRAALGHSICITICCVVVAACITIDAVHRSAVVVLVVAH